MWNILNLLNVGLFFFENVVERDYETKGSESKLERYGTKGESQGGERRGLIDGDKLNQKWKGLA